MIMLTIVLLIGLGFIIDYIKNDYVLKKEGSLVQDTNIYYNMKNILNDYFSILSSKNNVKKFKSTLIDPEKLSMEEFEELVETYDKFNIYLKEVYSLGNNTFRCNYTLLQDPEQYEGFLNYEELKDENEYHNIIVIRVNKEFNQYKILYNKFELNGGKVYEK